MSSFGGETAVTLAFVALAGWLFWLYHKTRRQRLELKQARLRLAGSALDKFGSAGEFIDFVHSREGRTLFDDPEPPEENRSRMKIRLVQIGVLLLCIGAGFLIGASLNKANSSPSPDVMDIILALNLGGVIGISAGIGFLVTTAATHLSERWFGRAKRGRS